MLPNWPLWMWVLSAVCIPVSLPWLAMQMVAELQYWKLKGRLKGKVVMITGASGGLGEALAHEFYRAGCRLILSARRESELDRVRGDLLRLHCVTPTHPPVVIPLDLADIKSLPVAVDKAIAICGCIDILVNNGGISHRGSAVDTNLDVDFQIMQVNYFGQVALSKAVLPKMIERKSGHIVAVSSIQGRIAIPFRSSYAASKHAFQAFCDSLRPEVAPLGVDITVVSPGYIRTSLSLNALTGSGEKYGVMDSTTAEGYSPEYVAKIIFRGVILKDKEILLAPTGPKIAVILRAILPSLYFWVMQRRSNKMIASESTEKVVEQTGSSQEDSTKKKSS